MAKAKRTVSTKGLVLVFIVLTFILLAAHLLMNIRPPNNPVAHIYMDGVEIEAIELVHVEKAFTLEISRHNTLLIEEGCVSMAWADCPDGLCVAQGKVSGVIPLACLPNRVVVRIENTREQEYDGVVS